MTYPDSSQPKPVTPKPPSPKSKKTKLLVPTVKRPQDARKVLDWLPGGRHLCLTADVCLVRAVRKSSPCTEPHDPLLLSMLRIGK